MGLHDLLTVLAIFFSLCLQCTHWTERRRRGWGWGQKRGVVRGHVLKRGWYEGGAESGEERGKLGGSGGRKGARGLARLGH